MPLIIKTGKLFDLYVNTSVLEAYYSSLMKFVSEIDVFLDNKYQCTCKIEAFQLLGFLLYSVI